VSGTLTGFVLGIVVAALALGTPVRVVVLAIGHWVARLIGI